MFILLHPRLGYEYGVASPRVLLAQASGRGWVATAHLTALKTMSSNLKSDFKSKERSGVNKRKEIKKNSGSLFLFQKTFIYMVIRTKPSVTIF